METELLIRVLRDMSSGQTTTVAWEAAERLTELNTALHGYVMAMDAGNPTLVEHADKQARFALAKWNARTEPSYSALLKG